MRHWKKPKKYHCGMSRHKEDTCSQVVTQFYFIMVWYQFISRSSPDWQKILESLNLPVPDSDLCLQLLQSPGAETAAVSCLVLVAVITGLKPLVSKGHYGVVIKLWWSDGVSWAWIAQTRIASGFIFDTMNSMFHQNKTSNAIYVCQLTFHFHWQCNAMNATFCRIWEGLNLKIK